MTVKLQLTPELQAVLLAQAQQSGLSLEAYAEQLLRERVGALPGPALTRSQMAGQRIRELRKGFTLAASPSRN